MIQTLLLLACESQAPAQAPPPVPTMQAHDEIVLQLDIIPPQGAAQSLRILSDGRYELRSTVAYSLGPDFRVLSAPQDAEWRLLRTVGAGDLESLRGAFVALNLSALEDRYSPQSPVSDTTTQVWTLGLASGARRIVVEGVPFVHVAALDALQVKVNALGQPARSAILRIGADERALGCDINAIPSLRPMLQALFDPSVAQPAAPGQRGAGGVLLEIVYLEDGVQTARCRLYADGTFTVERDGVETSERALSVAGVAAVKRALAGVESVVCP